MECFVRIDGIMCEREEEEWLELLKAWPEPLVFVDEELSLDILVKEAEGEEVKEEYDFWDLVAHISFDSEEEEEEKKELWMQKLVSIGIHPE